MRWPLVGREAELRFVAEALPGGVVIAGPAGVGKTRLATEAAALADRPAAWVRATRSAASIPLGAFAPLLPAAELPDGVELLARARHALAGRGLVLCVDDGHLLDDASAALVHQLVAAREVAALVTVRRDEPVPDALRALWKDDLCAVLELGELSRAGVAGLLAAALGGPVDGRTVAALWERTRGNALFLRELVRHGSERGLLREEGDVWRWRGPVEAGTRLAELVSERVEALGPRARGGLELLAAAGPLELALIDPAALEELERAELVERRADGRRRFADVAHPLHGEAVRARTTPSRLEAIQAGLADRVAACGARRSGDLLRVATWRLESGSRTDGALLARAAAHALGGPDTALAERLARAAVEAGAGFPAELVLGQSLAAAGRGDEAEAVLAALRPGDEAAWAAVAIARARNLFWALDRAEDADAVLREAEARLRDADAARRPDRAASPADDLAASPPSIAAQDPAAWPAAATAGDPVGSPPSIAAQDPAAWPAAATAGDPVGSPPTLSAGDPAASPAGAGSGAPSGVTAHDLAAQRVRLAAGHRPTEDVLRAAEPLLRDPLVPERAKLIAAPGAVEALLASGRQERAVALADEWLPAARERRHELPSAEPVLMSMSALALRLSGRLLEATAQAQRNYELLPAIRSEQGSAVEANLLGLIWLARGRVRTALRFCRESAALLREADAVGMRAFALAGIAQAAAQAGEADAAAASVAELARTPLGHKTFAVELELGRAWAAAAGGELSRARELARGAAALARERGQHAYTVRALHDLTRLGEPQPAELAELARRVDGPFAGAAAAHAAALGGGDGAALLAAAERFAEQGALLAAAEAADAAAMAHRDAGRAASARAAAARAGLWLTECEGARPPTLLAAPALDLTPREREIALLAAGGSSSREIAERLVVSVRTVDNHLQNAYRKLGVTRRQELSRVLAR